MLWGWYDSVDECADGPDSGLRRNQKGARPDDILQPSFVQPVACLILPPPARFRGSITFDQMNDVWYLRAREPVRRVAVHGLHTALLPSGIEREGLTVF